MEIKTDDVELARALGGMVSRGKRLAVDGLVYAPVSISSVAGRTSPFESEITLVLIGPTSQVLEPAGLSKTR